MAKNNFNMALVEKNGIIFLSKVLIQNPVLSNIKVSLKNANGI